MPPASGFCHVPLAGIQTEDAMKSVYLLNKSTLLTDAAVEAVVPAMQTQITRDFAPFYGIDATLAFAPTKIAPAGAWVLTILDDSDQAGALGYHEETGGGAPVGYVFVRSDLQAGLQWSTTLSHEILELLADPFVNLTVVHDKRGGSGVMVAYEVADSPEADQWGYKIGTVLVSDFVKPAWFGSAPITGDPHPYDFMGYCKQPFQILKGGYQGVRQFSRAGNWGQVNAAHAPNNPLGDGKWKVEKAMGNGVVEVLDPAANGEVPRLSRRARRAYVDDKKTQATAA